MGGRRTPGKKEVESADALKARALAGFAVRGSIADACKQAGIDRRTWLEWRRSDAEFGTRAGDLEEDRTDELEAQAIERAKTDSDTLLMFLLKARRPEQYREKHKIEVVHPKVKDNLRQTIAVINDECDHELANRILDRLNDVWGVA